MNKEKKKIKKYMEDTWEEKFDKAFVRKDEQIRGGDAIPEDIKLFISNLLAEVRAEEYRNGSKRIEAILAQKLADQKKEIVEKIKNWDDNNLNLKQINNGYMAVGSFKNWLLEEIEKL